VGTVERASASARDRGRAVWRPSRHRD